MVSIDDNVCSTLRPQHPVVKVGSNKFACELFQRSWSLSSRSSHPHSLPSSSLNTMEALTFNVSKGSSA